MGWHWVIPVDATRTPPDRFRVRFIVGCSVVGALWSWITAAMMPKASGVLLPVVAAIGGCLLACTILLVRRGYLRGGAAVMTAGVLSTMALVAAAVGPDSVRLGAVLAAPLLIAAAMGARAAMVAGAGLAMLIAGIALADAGGWDHWVEVPGDQPWQALVRQLVGVTALVLVLRLGYDRVHTELRALEREQETAARVVEEQAAVLEARVEERSAQLTRRLRAREELARAVADRLRQPLTRIEASLSQLSPEAAADRSIETARSAAIRMATMIERLLEHSRIGTELQATDVELDELVASIIDEQEAAEIDWHVAALPTVRGDPTLLRMAFENVIGNAVKFSAGRETSRIEVTRVPEQGAIRVRDNGVGFDMRFADKLFKPFQRLHGAGTFDGVGVGLANVRRIVEAHGGRCWAESPGDDGASIYLALPGLEGDG